MSEKLQILHLEDDPSDERALISLERLYQQTGEYRELVERESNATHNARLRIGERTVEIKQ